MDGLEFSELFTSENLREVVWPWLLDFGAKALRFALIPILAAIAARAFGGLAQRGVHRVLSLDDGEGTLEALERSKRTETVANVARRSVSVAVWATAVFMALSEIGFDIGPLIAGAGVAGLAIGFGAQNLVRDFLGGFFILLENQIRIGDVAMINGTSGVVEEINLRTTVLRDVEGTVHVFPNGAISDLANKTRDFSFYVFDVGVAYKEDADRVIALIRETVASLSDHEDFRDFILGEPDIFGLDRFGESAIVIKGRIRTAPGKQWMIGREFNRRLKQRFDKEGVEIPFPHRKLITETLVKPPPADKN